MNPTFNTTDIPGLNVKRFKQELTRHDPDARSKREPLHREVALTRSILDHLGMMACFEPTINNHTAPKPTSPARALLGTGCGVLPSTRPGDR